MKPKYDTKTLVRFKKGGPTIWIGEILDIRSGVNNSIEYLILGEHDTTPDWWRQDLILSEINRPDPELSEKNLKIAEIVLRALIDRATNVNNTRGKTHYEITLVALEDLRDELKAMD